MVTCFSLPCILLHSEVPLFRISRSSQCCLVRSLPTSASAGSQLNPVVGKYEGSVSQGRRWDIWTAYRFCDPHKIVHTVDSQIRIFEMFATCCSCTPWGGILKMFRNIDLTSYLSNRLSHSRALKEKLTTKSRNKTSNWNVFSQWF